MLKTSFLAGLCLVAACTTASAQYYGNNRNSGYGSYGSSGTGSNSQNHYVQPRFNNNGSITGGHYRTNPNSTTLDNYGTRGNYNPNTGTYGRRSPY